MRKYMRLSLGLFGRALRIRNDLLISVSGVYRPLTTAGALASPKADSGLLPASAMHSTDCYHSTRGHGTGCEGA